MLNILRSVASQVNVFSFKAFHIIEQENYT